MLNFCSIQGATHTKPATLSADLDYNQEDSDDNGEFFVYDGEEIDANTTTPSKLQQQQHAQQRPAQQAQNIPTVTGTPAAGYQSIHSAAATGQQAYYGVSPPTASTVTAAVQGGAAAAGGTLPMPGPGFFSSPNKPVSQNKHS